MNIFAIEINGGMTKHEFFGGENWLQAVFVLTDPPPHDAAWKKPHNHPTIRRCRGRRRLFADKLRGRNFD